MTLRGIVAGSGEPFVDALATLLLDMEGRLEIVGWARDRTGAVQLAKTELPDVALVASDTPPGDGVDVTKELVAANPSCHVIVVGSDGAPAEVERAWAAGAAGYVTLDAFGIDLIALALSAQNTRLNAGASFSEFALP